MELKEHLEINGDKNFGLSEVPNLQVNSRIKVKEKERHDKNKNRN